MVRNSVHAAALLLVFLLTGCAEDSATPEIADSDITLNNRGVALMGRFDYRGASDLFGELLDRQPDWHEVRTNYAIALKNRQQSGDAELALEQLEIVLTARPQDLRANYVAGVLQLYLGNVDPAAAYFESAISVEPNDAYAHYYLGQCRLRSDAVASALTSYQTAIEMDPYLRSAYYSAAQVLRRLGRNEEANHQLSLFQRFEKNPRARLAEFKYTRMGPLSLATVLGNEVSPDAPMTIPAGPLFADAREVGQLEIAGDKNTLVKAHLTTVDFDQDGSQDLFLSGSEASGSRLFLSKAESTENDQFTEHTSHPWTDVGDINAVAWGDINNDGLVDAYLCRSGPNQLWRQVAAGDWEQAGEDANVADGNKDCADATMVDADHDGDLDILIGNRAAGDNLLNNNRDGTFRSLADRLGKAAEVTNTRHLITTDIDSDHDIDLIFVNESAPHTILINDRLWDYLPSTDHDELLNSSIMSMAAVDIDANGQTELLTVDRKGTINMWQPNDVDIWQAKNIYQSALAVDATVDMVPLDLNGNGYIELAIIAEGAFEIVAFDHEVSNGSKGTQLLLEQHAGGAVIPVTRSTRGSSLIALESSARGLNLVEWAPGAGRFEFATLTFSGKHDAAETMRSNHSGIGTQVSVRTGSKWSRSDNFKHSSLAGYSLQPLSVGLGGQQKADFIAVDWSDGVYQTEIDVKGGSVALITEEQRQLGSCPVLFVWDGSEFNFVTDVLGVAAQGFLVEPGTLLPPRPWERVAFAPGSIASREGRIIFKVTEPMEENSYIDSMTLESYDLPVDWQVIVDERMGTAAPQVTGETMFYKNSISPVRAFNSNGTDVLEAVFEHDQRAMSPGEIDPRYIGLLTEPESLTIEFDKRIDKLAQQPDAIPVLVAENWVELPYSQTHFAAWQAGKHFRSISLEARDEDGVWRMVYPEFGIPGGMPRTMSLPLTALPEGTDALRLSWNRQLYWDRIRVVYAENPPLEVQPRILSPSLAKVSKTGFFERVSHAQRRPEYLYQNRKPFGDVRYPTGFYTNLGEMTSLISSADDALAIIGPGEEIHVEFESTAPPAPGMERWYVLDIRGWAKDSDTYTHQGDTVGPLPRAHPNASNLAREALHQKFNTRFQSGR